MDARHIAVLCLVLVTATFLLVAWWYERALHKQHVTHLSTIRDLCDQVIAEYNRNVAFIEGVATLKRELHVKQSEHKAALQQLEMVLETSIPQQRQELTLIHGD